MPSDAHGTRSCRSALLSPYYNISGGKCEIFHDGGIVDVQDGPADAVHIAVAGAGDAVVEQQPPFAGLDGRRASAEHADEAVPVGHHGAVEDSNHILQGGCAR